MFLHSTWYRQPQRMLQCLGLFSSLSVQDQSHPGGFCSVLTNWGSALSSSQYQSATRQQLRFLLLSPRRKSTSCCVNTQLVFAAASSAGMGRNLVFHFPASLVFATEQCRSKKAHVSPASVKKRCLGIMRILCFTKENCSKLVTYL